MKAAADYLATATHVVFATPDFHGRLLGKKRRAGEWPSAASDGVAMPDFYLICDPAGRPLPGFDVAGAHAGFRNGLLKPDPAAAFELPTEPGVAHVICDGLTSGGEPVREAPRSLLRGQLARLEERGIAARAASELEFYVLEQSYREANALGYAKLRPLYHRSGDNEVTVGSLFAPLADAIERALEVCGIVVDQIQAEGGAGQMEVNVAPAALLTAADEHIVFKHVVKACAHQLGHAVTFMAKPFEHDAGSGGHIHLSLRKDGGNLLGEGRQLSAFGAGFVAGILHDIPDLTLMLAPYANSYKRLVPLSYAPLASSWAWDNRTAMVRLIAGRDGPRIELRMPGADVNPYHAYAAVLAAGMAGVDAGLALPPEKHGDTDPPGSNPLPADLTEATERFARSRTAIAAFGSACHQHILSHARHELAATRRAVTEWEIARGFEHA
ncbi:MAG: glutamine synthetase family protein [Parvibaculaceae bacterium]